MDADRFKWLYFSLRGRITRRTYWTSYFLPMAGVWVVFRLTVDPHHPPQGAGFGLLCLIAGLAILWSGIAVHAKRWHDLGKSGWWSLVGIIPVLGGLVMLVAMGFLRGTSGPNRFGDEQGAVLP